MHHSKLLAFSVASLAGLLSARQAHAEGARYLIICPDAFEDVLAPLAEWKTRKGMQAKIVVTSDIGFSSSQIKEYITDAVETWDPPPEYVLIGADMDTIPMGSIDGVPTDTYYANMDGDPFIEIIPARFPAQDIAQIETMVQRTLQYERTPSLDNEFYYKSAALLVYEDSDDDDICSYFGDCYWEAALMERVGHTDIAIMSYPGTTGVKELFRGMLEDGLGWASHHGVIGGYTGCGWPGYDVDPRELSNGPMLPVVLGYSCQTLAYSGYECYGEQWVRARHPDTSEPIGAVGYVGQSYSCSYCAQWRSALRRGFYGYIFEDTEDWEITTFGDASEGARLRFYDEFQRTDQYYASVLYADPELNLWTTIPQDFDISHPPSIARGELDFTVLVSQEGHPRQGALVCVMSDGGTYSYGYTDAEGLVTLSVDTMEDEFLYITATGRNLMPYEGQIAIGGEPVKDTSEPDEPEDTDTEEDTDDEPDSPNNPDQEQDEGISSGGTCGCHPGLAPLSPLPLLLLLPALARRREPSRRAERRSS